MTRRTLAIAALVCVTLSACGHYGPPVPPAPREKDGYVPLPEPDPPDQPSDAEHEHHG
jgi:hypothetical protein